MENEKLQEQTESMADYEDHFDDANPWNVVARYQEEGTNLHVKVEGIVNGGVIAILQIIVMHFMKFFKSFCILHWI